MKDAQVVVVGHEFGVEVEEPIEAGVGLRKVDLTGHDQIGRVMVALGFDQRLVEA